MRNIFTYLMLVFILLSSFTPVPDKPVTLETHTWTLTTIYRDNGYTQVLTGTAFINFQTDKEKINGNGSCNTFGATVTIDGNTISFRNIYSTKMYCSDGQSIEKEFFKQLKKVTRYEIKGNKLLLFEGDNLLLEFVG